VELQISQACPGLVRSPVPLLGRPSPNSFGRICTCVHTIIMVDFFDNNAKEIDWWLRNLFPEQSVVARDDAGLEDDELTCPSEQPPDVETSMTPEAAIIDTVDQDFRLEYETLVARLVVLESNEQERIRKLAEMKRKDEAEKGNRIDVLFA